VPHTGDLDSNMPETRTPRARPLLRLLAEAALLSVGVFLGLAGDQWRENADHRATARASLRRFRAEIVANRQAVTNVRDYHAHTLGQVRAYLAKDHRTRNTADVELKGLRPVAFAHTAWDLALVTQSLTYIDPDVAFALSRVYGKQQEYGELTRGMMQAMYLLDKRENFDGLAAAVESYFGDLVGDEPMLLAMYAEILPQIDRALGERR
jgi:hypothetical protein